MTNVPQTDHDTAGVEALRKVGGGEQIPFSDNPALCHKCGGDLAILQTTKVRRGKVVVAVHRETVVCPRCAGGQR